MEVISLPAQALAMGQHFISYYRRNSIDPVAINFVLFFADKTKEYDAQNACHPLKTEVRYHQVKKWLIYPLTYYVLINIRGSVSGFYPYPFVDVTRIGWTKALINSGLIIVFFVIVAFSFIAIRRTAGRRFSS